MAKTIRLIGPSQRDYAKRMIDEAPDGYVCKLAEETRSDRQNRAMWGWIKQLRAALPEFEQYSPEDCKLRLMHALGTEMRFLPELEGGGMFPVGYKSSELTVAQFSALQMIIQTYAASHGVELIGSD
jgi:hypothetical protein